MNKNMYLGCLRRFTVFHKCKCGKNKKLRFFQVRKYSVANLDNPNPKYYITTPIFYVNASPHIGHLYTATMADVIARWWWVKGHTSFLSTGTDEHGQKIQQSAKVENLSPLQFCDKVSVEFQEMMKLANINHSCFVRTTSEEHKQAVCKMWNTLWDKGLIYKDVYRGWYCVSDEHFVGEQDIKTQIINGAEVKVTTEGEKLCEWVEEENYMFRLTQFEGQLRRWLQNGVVFPEEYANSLMFLLDNLRDLSVSRSRNRIRWGIPVPGDDSQTIYVWLDALTNYLTAVGYHKSNNLSHWPPDCHVIGKDILKFHAVYWPAFLLGAGLPLPKTILCHSHFTVNQEKMSKSRGNVVDPRSRIDLYSTDGFRFYLMYDLNPRKDCNYSDEIAKEYINALIVNSIGNLLHRCTGQKINKAQTMPMLHQSALDSLPSDDKQMFHKLTANLPDEVDRYFNVYRVDLALREIMDYIRWGNKLVDEYKFWELAKNPAQKDLLDTILNMVLETLRVSGILLQPVVPGLANKLLNRLQVPTDRRSFEHAQQKLKVPEEGLPLGQEKSVLMPRLP